MQKQLSGSDRNIGKQIILGIILIALLMQRFKKRVILMRFCEMLKTAFDRSPIYVAKTMC